MIDLATITANLARDRVAQQFAGHTPPPRPERAPEAKGVVA
jgi:hypothetical protein